MSTTNTTLATILLVLASTTVLSAPASLTGCASLNEKTQRCDLCYQRLSTADGGCGAESSEGNCEFYSYAKKTVRCNNCKPGFFSNYYGKGLKDDCLKVKKVLPNCETYGFSDDCVLCKGGFAAGKEGGCVSFADLGIKDTNCLWGGNYNPKLKAGYCLRCKNGFARNLYGNCVKSDYNLGCLTVITGREGCVDCNVYEGFSARPGRKCVKDFAAGKRTSIF